MRKITLFILITLLFTKAFASQEKVKITFEVITPIPLSIDEKIYITGNKEALGFWNPSFVKMNRVNETKWNIILNFTRDDILEYKFTKGNWEQEASDSLGRPWNNLVLKIQNDTIINTKINFWKNNKTVETEGKITGDVRYHYNIIGDGLKARNMIVWLPPQYEKNLTERFSVLYMHDGQNIIDPNTSAFKVDWQLDETADSLIETSQIEPFIIVGIYNTPDRSEEYSPGNTGMAYINLVINTIKPLIDKTYRTKQGNQFTYTGGSSMGGLISFMLVWENPDIFGGAICMSPAFKIGEYNYVDDVVDYKGSKPEIKIYIDNGGIGLEEELQPGINEMLTALQNKGFKSGENLLWVKDKNARHSEADWAARAGLAMKFLIGNLPEN